VAGLVISLLEVKQAGRFFSSDGGDGEGVLANLLIFLECSDSYYYIDKRRLASSSICINRFKL
jgi:hypothetical protein